MRHGLLAEVGSGRDGFTRAQDLDLADLALGNPADRVFLASCSRAGGVASLAVAADVGDLDDLGAFRAEELGERGDGFRAPASGCVDRGRVCDRDHCHCPLGDVALAMAVGAIQRLCA